MPRPPDINLDTTTIPDGQYLLEGNFLTATIRKAGIPYGTVTQRKQLPGGQRYNTTVGVVLYEADRAAVDVAMVLRAKDKEANLKFPCRQKRTD